MSDAELPSPGRRASSVVLHLGSTTEAQVHVDYEDNDLPVGIRLDNAPHWLSIASARLLASELLAAAQEAEDGPDA